jgi:tetratricopeptide (TPR) repeat protein
MSGGARLALAWGQNGSIAGVIACAAGFGSELPRQVPFRLYATTGVDDFNHDELFQNSLDLARRGIAHRFVEFDGGHDWLPQPLAADALDYFMGKVPAQSAQPSKRQQKVAALSDSRMRQVLSAEGQEKRGLLADFRKDAARPDDSDQRRVARRVLMGTFVSMLEQGRGLMAQKSYVDAANNYEVALMAHPDDPGAWYSLAVARSASGNKRSALDALEHAAANGFHDRERMEGEVLLERLRNQPRYRALVAKMK